MALLFMDSFDHYATADLLGKWTASSSATIAAGAGRRGSSALRTPYSGPWVSKGLSTTAPLVVGVAVKPGVLNQFVCELGESGHIHMGLFLRSDGGLSFQRFDYYTSWATAGGTVVANTAPGLIAAGLFSYIEIKVVIADAPTGSVTLRLNGVQVLTASGLDTRDANTPNLGYANILYLGNDADFDDLYVLDTTGPAPWNDFLGDCRVDARVATGVGATTAWTPSAGANWQTVDDAAPNADTDYVATTTVPATDTYAVQDAPVPGAVIYGVQHCVSLKKMDAGVCTVAPVIRHAGVDYPGADLSPGTSYAYGLQIAQVNPGTGAAWTEAGFNAAEFGVKRTS